MNKRMGRLSFGAIVAVGMTVFAGCATLFNNSNPVQLYTDGLYRYHITDEFHVSSRLKSTLETLLKYPDLQRAFVDLSLPIPPDTLRSYSIDVYDNNSTYEQISLDSYPYETSTFVFKLSDRYEAPTVIGGFSYAKWPVLPQEMIDKYKAYLDELLENPEFIALSQQLRSQEAAKIRSLKDQEEKERLTHATMLEERGITEQQWQMEEAERQRQERLQEQQARRSTSQNLIRNLLDVGTQIGIPFEEGDEVTLPPGLLSAVDLVQSRGSNTYLVLINDNSGYMRPFYIRTTMQLPFTKYNYGLTLLEQIKIRYVGITEYLDSQIPRETLLFEVTSIGGLF